MENHQKIEMLDIIRLESKTRVRPEVKKPKYSLYIFPRFSKFNPHEIILKEENKLECHYCCHSRYFYKVFLVKEAVIKNLNSKRIPDYDVITN